jgi:hypothetical protein
LSLHVSPFSVEDRVEVGGKTHHFHLHRKCPLLHTLI